MTLKVTQGHRTLAMTQTHVCLIVRLTAFVEDFIDGHRATACTALAANTASRGKKKLNKIINSPAIAGMADRG